MSVHRSHYKISAILQITTALVCVTQSTYQWKHAISCWHDITRSTSLSVRVYHSVGPGRLHISAAPSRPYVSNCTCTTNLPMWWGKCAGAFDAPLPVRCTSTNSLLPSQTHAKDIWTIHFFRNRTFLISERQMWYSSSSSLDRVALALQTHGQSAHAIDTRLIFQCTTRPILQSKWEV